MTIQPEQHLENNLISQLEKLRYKKVVIRNEEELLTNLKTQLEIHNKVKLTEKDFKQILIYINKGNVFQRAHTLRERIPYTNHLGENKTIELLNKEFWCQNEFQVAQQIEMKGSFKNRYDVTILVNGLPLVQIELKRRGLELKEAFNQTNRYQRHSYEAGYGLFQYIQIFVISNGVNTKYYCNGTVQQRSFKQTFFWADKDNKIITELDAFAQEFLEPCHLTKMITKYMVMNQTQKGLMVLRPYQYYAVESIVNQVKETTKNGYIWHTTGSGKTLTSFKTAQVLTENPDVDKILFVVDRKDLDYQTTKEFNSFEKDSVNATTNTGNLVKQLKGNSKLVVTTLQKLNTAIKKKKYLSQLEDLKKQKVVFLFDECHRSQFGATHKAITDFFENCQMFGFTGTPIFEKNASKNDLGKRTTKDLFGEKLHSYVITDAIRDKNVLKFGIEYFSTFKKKDGVADDEVSAIDEAEAWSAPVRLLNNVNYIIDNHQRKTHSGSFNAFLCVGGTPQARAYYELFKELKSQGKHSLKVATIFTYKANPEDEDSGTSTGTEYDEDDDDIFDEDESISMVADPQTQYKTEDVRSWLENTVQEYNQEYGVNFSTKESNGFYRYYEDITKRVKHKEIDLLIVVNMVLTGFDSKTLNTLYVDKNLKHHGLIQAFSRTNRIYDDLKSQGNIVCFRNLKNNTDEAITLFADKNAKEEIFIPPLEDVIQKFNEAYDELIALVPSVQSVDELPDEDAQAEFIKLFRTLMRIRNKLGQFSEFDSIALKMTEQEFEDYKSKYLDLYDGRSKTGQKESILDDLDFEVELIHRDEVNVVYILQLLAKLVNAKSKDKQKQIQVIMDMLSSEVTLRSKKELIEKFIEKNLPHITDSDTVQDEFEGYIERERKQAIQRLGTEEKLDTSKLESIIGEYLYTNKKPLREDIVGTMLYRPALKDRSSTTERISHRIMDFVNTFVSGFV